MTCTEYQNQILDNIAHWQSQPWSMLRDRIVVQLKQDLLYSELLKRMEFDVFGNNKEKSKCQ